MARAGVVAEEAVPTRDLVGGVAYRPHLDGLRAFAVYLVVLFHAGSRWFAGGYIGVDIFFVLSGYLVTQLLFRDIDRLGSIRFSRFYARRFRRLLPAAFIVLIVTGLVYTALASPVEVSKYVGSFKAAFLYVTNWYFIRHANDYFGPDINANPVVQFWSLAVEEQFYLLWPLTLGGMLFFTRRFDPRRQRTILRWAVVVGAVGSAAWALALRASNPTRAYYGTDARAYELLAGAALALAPRLVDTARAKRVLSRIALPACVALVLLLASDWISLGPVSRGIGVTLVTCVFLITLEAASGGVVHRVLTNARVVYLGRISYGTYLWHWIVIIVLVRAFHLSTLTTVALACLLATALASLSFTLLEHPIRIAPMLDRHRGLVIAAGLTISALSALVLVPRIVDPAHAVGNAVHRSASTSLTPVPRQLGAGEAYGIVGKPGCPLANPGPCTVVDGKRGHLLLIGDSQAESLIPVFTLMAHRDGFTFSRAWLGGCPWQQNLFTGYLTDHCKAVKKKVYDNFLKTQKVGLVVVIELGYGEPGPAPVKLRDKSGKFAAADEVAAETQRSVAVLRTGGRRVLLIDPTPTPLKPTPDFDPRACLATAQFVEDCRYTTRTDKPAMQRVYERIADGKNARTLDIGPMICPDRPVCDAVIGGVLVKTDPVHVTADYALRMEPQIETFLRAWTAKDVVPPSVSSP